ncbi:hypothetical protein HALLA_14755 [Halostagnicola larsenii XH-48]|uniref:DUF8055 domain-containing protein n=1 Tax=Halostagnicola larsenii XH-48 TaxID=797299 RepID=W0JMD0_9EURY|nr:hypothetical protein [Halostagnicola larsenii]AHF99860.1 hypothetical protein HALLA_14755 [Halostagnicola larsenii XH-48]
MSRYGPRIAALARRADRDRATFDPETATPADGRTYLREGAGPAIWLYLEGRTGGRTVRFSDLELTALRGAMNAWLTCYARCHGVSLEADFTVREAATVLLETRNVFETAQLLTHVPQRAEDPRRTGHT